MCIYISREHGNRIRVEAREEVARELARLFEVDFAEAFDKQVTLVLRDADPKDIVSTLRNMGIPRENILVEGGGIGFLSTLRKLSKARRGAVVVCPRCGSSEIKQSSFSGWLLPATYRCERCGYIGHIVLEIGEGP